EKPSLEKTRTAKLTLPRSRSLLSWLRRLKDSGFPLRRSALRLDCSRATVTYRRASELPGVREGIATLSFGPATASLPAASLAIEQHLRSWLLPTGLLRARVGVLLPYNGGRLPGQPTLSLL